MKRRRLRRVIVSFFSPYRARLLAILGLALSVSVLAAGEPLLLKLVFDSFTNQSGTFARIALLVGGLVVSLLAREGLSALLDRCIWTVRIGVGFDMMHATVDR